MLKFLVVVTCLSGHQCPMSRYETEVSAINRDECVALVQHAVAQLGQIKNVHIVCEPKK